MSTDVIARAADLLRDVLKRVPSADNENAWDLAVYGMPEEMVALIKAMGPQTMTALHSWFRCVLIDDEYEPESAPRIRERTTATTIARAVLGEAAP